MILILISWLKIKDKISIDIMKMQHQLKVSFFFCYSRKRLNNSREANSHDIC